MKPQEKERETPNRAKGEKTPPADSRIDHEDPVEEASDESFPASDPPAKY